MKKNTKKPKIAKTSKFIDKLYFQQIHTEIRMLAASFNKITSIESCLKIEIDMFVFTDYEMNCFNNICIFLRNEKINFSTKSNYEKKRLVIQLKQNK